MTVVVSSQMTAVSCSQDTSCRCARDILQLRCSRNDSCRDRPSEGGRLAVKVLPAVSGSDPCPHTRHPHPSIHHFHYARCPPTAIPDFSPLHPTVILLVSSPGECQCSLFAAWQLSDVGGQDGAQHVKCATGDRSDWWTSTSRRWRSSACRSRGRAPPFPKPSAAPCCPRGCRREAGTENKPNFTLHLFFWCAVYF